MIAKSLHQIVSTSRSLLVGDAARLEAAPPGTITVHHSFGDPDDPLEDFHITEHAPPPKPAKKVVQRADQLFDDDADTRFELVLPWTQTKAPPAVSSILSIATAWSACMSRPARSGPMVSGSGDSAEIHDKASL